MLDTFFPWHTEPKLRILIITAFFPPSEFVAAQRAWGFAKAWSRAGHDVTVLAPEAEAPPGWAGRILTMAPPPSLLFLRKLFGKGTGAPSRAIARAGLGARLKTTLKMQLLAAGIGSSVRWPDPLGLWFRRARALLGSGDGGPFDLVVSTFGPPGAHLLAEWYVERHPGVFWVADFRDLWTRNHHFPGLPMVRLWERYLERRILTRAGLVTTVSEPLASVLRADAPEKVRVVFNGYDPEDWVALQSAPTRKAKLELFYGGSYYPGRMRVELFLDALAELRAEGVLREGDLRADFCGPRTDLIVAAARERGLGGFLTGGDVRARTEVLSAQRAADVLLFFGYQDERREDEGILTGKLFEYLGSGTSLFGVGLSANLEAGRLILESGRGLLASSEVQEIKRALRRLLEDGARSFVADPSPRILELTRERQAQRLLEFVASAGRDTDR